MAEIQIQNEIDKLKKIASNWVDSSELEEVKSILEVIKPGASKEQLEEIIKLLDNEVRTFQSGNFVAVNTLNSHKEDFENLLSKYNTEKQIIVDESVESAQDIKWTIVKPIESEQIILNKYNERFIKKFEKRINNVISKLDENNEEQKKLKDELKKLLENPSNSQVELIQNIIVSLWGKVSKSGNADWFFGPKTIKALENIVGIEVVSSNVNNSVSKNNKPAVPSTKRSANISVLKTNNENILVNKVVVWYSKNWANYIIWADWKEKLITYETLSPEYKKLLEKNKDLLLRIENFNLIAEAARQNWNSNLVNWLNKRLANLSVKTLGEMDSYIQANAAWVNLKSKASVLNYIRDEIWNTNFVLNELSNELFNKNTKISEKEIQDFINNPSLEHKKIKSLAKWEYKELVNDVIDKKAEAEKYFAEYKPTLQKQYPKLNPEQLRELVISSFLNWFAKAKILEIQFESFKNIDKSKTPLAYLFSDITWAWTLKGSSINISDSNKMWWKEALILVATEAAAIAVWAVTMWAWAYAVNAAVYWIRAVRWLNYMHRVWEAAKNGSKLAQVARWWAMSGVEWTWFWIWHSGAKSLIEWESMFSRKWLWESIAFAWAFRWLNWIYKLAKIDLKPNIPLNQQKIKLTSQLLADTTAFSALWLWFEWKILEPGEWTAETILQAFMMAAVFKGAWISMEKIKFRRNWEKVEAVKEEKVSSNETKTEQTSSEWPKFSSKEWREIIKEAKNIEANRVIEGNEWKLSWEYSIYNQRYQDLYKKLDNEWILNNKLRWKEIKKLDREITKEILQKAKSSADEWLKTKSKTSENEKTTTENKTEINANYSKELDDLLLKRIWEINKWETKDFWNFKVCKEWNWEYTINWQSFKEKSDLINYIKKNSLSTPKERFEFVQKNFDMNIAKAMNKEIIIWDKTYRLTKDWIQEKWEFNSWKNVERELSKEEMAILTKSIFWNKFDFFSFRKNAENVKCEDMMTKSEKEFIVKRWWKAWYNKIAEWFKEFKTAVTSWTKETLSFVTWIWKSTTTYKWAILWTAAWQWIQITSAWWDSYAENFHWKDIAEIIWEILVFRYMWALRWSIATLTYAWFDSWVIQEYFWATEKTPTPTYTEESEIPQG